MANGEVGEALVGTSFILVTPLVPASCGLADPGETGGPEGILPDVEQVGSAWRGSANT